MARAFRRKGQRYVAKFDEMERGVVAGLLEQTRDIVAPTDAGEPPVANPDAFDDIVAGVSVGAEDHVASAEELAESPRVTRMREVGDCGALLH